MGSLIRTGGRRCRGSTARLFGEARQLSDSAHQSGKCVALRAHRFTHTDEQTLHLKDLLQLLVVGLEEDRVL
jgi:hypothetical protein